MSRKRTKEEYYAQVILVGFVIGITLLFSLVVALFTPLDFLPLAVSLTAFLLLALVIVRIRHYRSNHPPPPVEAKTAPEVTSVTTVLQEEATTEPYMPSISDTQAIPISLGSADPPDTPNEDLSNLSDRELAILQVEAIREMTRITARQTESQLAMHEEDHPATYQHRFHIMKLIIDIAGILFIAVLLTVAVFFIDDFVPSFSPPPQAYWILVIGWVIVLLWIWFAWLAWFNRDFVANVKRCSMPRPMPWPIPDDNPTIDVGISSIAIDRGFIDKLFKTCTLRMDSPSEGDEMFAVVHWLKYPNELRDALGLTPPDRKRLLRRRKKSA